MRKSPAPSNTIPFAVPAERSFGRRPLASFFGHLTCLALVKHHETAKAVFVSDDGDAVGAVWVPKALLTLDKVDRGKFLVATMSQALADQKRLTPSFVDYERRGFTEQEQAQLGEARELARRTRQRLRGDQSSRLSHFGRNEFA